VRSRTAPALEETKNQRRARQGLYDAQRAWCEAAEAGRKEESIEAGVRLAGLLAAEREEFAKKAYEKAIVLGPAEAARIAGKELELLPERGD
jgi:hypothetical protein